MSQVESKPFQRNPRFTYTGYAQRGRSGEVLIGGIDTERKFKVAIKQPNMQEPPETIEKNADNIVSETRALKIMQGVRGVCELLDDGAEPAPDMPGVYAYAYIVMTFAEGKPLEDWIKEYHQAGAVIPWLEVLLIFEKLTALLAEAHNRGVVHNDVDVKQIFWERETETLTLIDWGNVEFFKEKESGAGPQKDIRQVGEALFKVGTQMDVSSVHTPEALPWGAAKLPTGVRDVIVKAKFSEVAVAGRGLLPEFSYTDMASLHDDIKRLYEAAYDEAKGELDTFWKRASNPESQSPLDDLQNLKHVLATWPAGKILQDDVRKLSEAIDKKLHWLQEQADWQEARIGLETGEFDRALPILQRLLQQNTIIKNVDLKLITNLCRMFAGNSSENLRAAAIFEPLLTSGSQAAVDALMTLYHAEVKTYRVATDRSPAQIGDAMYLLTRNISLNAVRVHLEWLERQVEDEEKRLRDDRAQKKRRSRLLDINEALTELIEKYLYCPSSAELSYERMRKTYTQVHERLIDIGRSLNDLGYRDLATLAELLQQQARKIAPLLEPYAGASRNIAAEAHNLEEACRLDASNPDLRTLREMLRAAVQTWERWQNLNDSPKPLDWDEFERLHDAYKTLGLTDNPQLRGLREQWLKFEEAYRAWGDSESQSAELSQTLLIRAKALPPLYGFLEHQEKKARATESSTLPDSSTTPPNGTESRGTTDSKSPGASDSSSRVGSALAVRSASTSQYATGDPYGSPSSAGSASTHASTLSGQTSAPGGVQATSSSDPLMQRIESLITAGKYSEALEELKRPTNESFKQKNKRHGEYLQILKSWNDGIYYLTMGEFEAAKGTLANLPGFFKGWGVTTSDSPSKLMYDRLTDLHKEVSKIHQEWQQTKGQGQADVNWNGMTRILEDVEKILEREGMSTENIMEQKRLHKSLQNACEIGTADEYSNARRTFQSKYPKHDYLAVYRHAQNSISPASQAPLPSQLAQQKLPEPIQKSRGLGAGEWAMIAVVFLVVLAVIAMVAWTYHQGFQDSTPTPLPTHVAWTPTPRAMRKTMLEYCHSVEAATRSQEWETALKVAEDAKEAFKAVFGDEAQNISPECNLHIYVGQAGRELTQQQYKEEQYEQAKATADRALKLLQELVPDTSVPKGEYRALDILQQCAVYQQIRLSDPAKAGEALGSLRRYQNEPRFYSDFQNLCSLNFDKVLVALTPTPEVCINSLPELISPEEKAGFNLDDTTEFRWQAGQICEGQVWLVTIDGQDNICPSTTENHVHCLVPMNAIGWSVEIRNSADNSVVPNMMTPLRKFH